MILLPFFRAPVHCPAASEQTFIVGERVTFQPEGHPLLVAMVTRYNKKTVTVITENRQHWHVCPGLVRKAEPFDRIDSGNAKVILLGKK